ncbi:MAG: glycosyltransferase family 2 protein, partial [Bacteroidales bacterium]|nr:glycosyltransferase family 2 protein [Bacteroidales bacterium]
MIPEISIVIPAYKAVPFIGRLLSQIYAQDFDKNFECIVVDDCSPDDTPGAFRKAAESCPPHIDLKYIRNEVNRGPSFTRNEGIRAATGKYILMFDCDDEITPDCLSVIWNIAVKYGFPDMVVGSIISESPKIIPSSNFDEKGLPDYVGTHEEAEAMILDVWNIPQYPINKLLKRELFEHYPWVYFNEEVRIAEDMCWTFFLAKAVNTLAVSKKPTYV